MAAVQETVDRVRQIDVDQYRYGFETIIESDKAPKGLSEDTVRFISGKKNEPAWMLEWRLQAYRRWLTMTEPKWARVDYPKIDYQDLYYYSAPKPKKTVSSLDEIAASPPTRRRGSPPASAHPPSGSDSSGPSPAPAPRPRRKLSTRARAATARAAGRVDEPRCAHRPCRARTGRGRPERGTARSRVRRRRSRR